MRNALYTCVCFIGRVDLFFAHWWIWCYNCNSNSALLPLVELVALNGFLSVALTWLSLFLVAKAAHSASNGSAKKLDGFSKSLSLISPDELKMSSSSSSFLLPLELNSAHLAVVEEGPLLELLETPLELESPQLLLPLPPPDDDKFFVLQRSSLSIKLQVFV